MSMRRWLNAEQQHVCVCGLVHVKSRRTFSRVVLRRHDVLIPDYLLGWIKGHLVKLLDLRDSALMSGHLGVFVCVANRQRQTERNWVNEERPPRPLRLIVWDLYLRPLLEDNWGKTTFCQNRVNSTNPLHHSKHLVTTFHANT